jgi:hypothetical protein
MDVSMGRPHPDPESLLGNADTGEQRSFDSYYAEFCHILRDMSWPSLPSNPSILTAFFQTSRNLTLRNHPLLLLL